jgi:hypothetical protein
MIKTGILQIVIILFVLGQAFSQDAYKGIIKDSKSKFPVPYASIKVKNKTTQSIANADGRFSLPSGVFNDRDTIIISCVGYSPKSVVVKNIGVSFVVFLTPRTYQLNDVNITSKGNVDYPYQLFSELCQRYRKYAEIVPAKGYFSFLCQYEDLPLEIVEGYFNGDVSCKSGISSLALKNGRIGFCLNSFYSLNTTDIFTHFNLFSLAGNLNIPSSAGNFNYRQLKKLYDVRIIQTSSEGGNKIYILQFQALKDSTNLFSGIAWINATDKTFEKLEYTLNDNDFYYFRPLIAGDKIDSIQVGLVFTFDNSKAEHPVIDRTSLDYSMLYTSLHSSNTLKIKSEATLLFYDYSTPFPGMIPDKLVDDQDNDYQKISCLPYDSIFWTHTEIIPQSDKQKQFIMFFHENGVLINFSRTLDSLSNFNYIHWSSSSDVLQSDLLNIRPPVHFSSNGTASLNNKNPNFYNIDCQILLNPVEIADSVHLTSVTLLNKTNSYYFLGKGSKAALFINLTFDLFEKKRIGIMANYYSAAKSHRVTFEELRSMYNTALHQLNDTIKIFHEETQDGTSIKDLTRWCKKVALETGVDRSSLIQKMLDEETSASQRKKSAPAKK